MRKLIAGLLLVSALSSLAAVVAFAGDFAKRHPRRAEVNRRQRNQQKRIAQGVASGRMTASQAAQVEQNAAAIKAQERADVKANGGYLTPQQKQQLNQEQNQNSQQIYQDKHGGH